MSHVARRGCSDVTALSRLMHRLRGGRCDLIGYSLWTRLRWLDLAGASQEEMGTDRSHAGEHANSGGPDLARVLGTLNISAAHRIVDFGSGKGGAAFTMSRFPFSEILGIELSHLMVRIARQNAIRLGV